MKDLEMLFLTVLISVLMLLVMHLLRIAFFKTSMPDWARHIQGVLGLAIPLSMLFFKWQSWDELIALWLVIGFGGGILLLAFVLESWHQDRTARIQAEEREQQVVASLRGSHEQGE